MQSSAISSKNDDASMLEHKNTAKFGMRRQIATAESKDQYTGQGGITTRNGADVMDICFESFNPLSAEQELNRKLDDHGEIAV